MWLLDKDSNLKKSLETSESIHSITINGPNTLSLTTDDHVEKYDMLLYRDELLNYHEFMVQRITENGITNVVYAEHSSYELYASYVANRRPTETVRRHLEILLENTRWEAGEIEIGETIFLSYYYLPVYSAIQKLCSEIDGELRFRIEVDGNKITHRYVDIVRKIGFDTGKRFTYTKDLIGVERTVLSDDVVTALVGRGRGEEIDDGFGRRITFIELNKIDSPAGYEYVFDDEARLKWGILSEGTMEHRFGLMEFDEIEDVEELYEATRKELQRLKEPQINYECSVALLVDVRENVSIGDVVAIIDNDFNDRGLRIKGRVIKLDKNINHPEYSTVVLGNFERDVFDQTMSISDYVNSFRGRTGVWDRSNAFDSNNQLEGSYIKELLKAWNDNINQTGGFVYAEHGKGIMTYDNPIDGNPTKVTQLVGGALRIANSKLPNGDWDWRTVLTGDGIAGQEIVAGSITTNKVSSDFGASLDISSNESISLLSQKMNVMNLIPNLNGEGKYDGWLFDGDPSKFSVSKLFGKFNLFQSKTSPLFSLQTVDSISGISSKFSRKGKSLSPFSKPIVPDMIHSFNVERLMGNQPFILTVVEHDNEKTEIKRTAFTLSGNGEPDSFSINLLTSTLFVKLEIETLDDSPLELTDLMFNRGQPHGYVRSADDAIVYANAQLSLRDAEIAFNTQAITDVNGDIHNAGIDIAALTGINVNGKKFVVWNEAKTKKLFEVVTVEGDEVIYMNAQSGDVGNFSLVNGVMEYTTPTYFREYTMSDLAYVRNIILKSEQATSEDLLIYDLNNDGAISLVDMALIRADILGNQKINRVVRSYIKIGTNNGDIETIVEYLVDGVFVSGERSIVKGIEVRSRNIVADSVVTNTLGIAGKLISVDSNGFVKATEDILT